MIFWLLIFFIFSTILWKSSNRVLISVKKTARAYHLSEIAVTLLGLSILASFPEFLVSASASIMHYSDISLGTVIGSNIFTLLVVLGIAAIIRPFHVKMVIEERDSVWMLLSGAVLLIFLSGGISRWEGILLAILYLPYIYSVYLREKERKTKTHAHNRSKLKKGKEVVILVLATCIMLISAEIVLHSILKLSSIFQMPKLIISLILMGVGASIPETVIGVSSALQKKTDITLGDVYGTNIFTCLFILGVCAIIHPIPTSSQVQSFILPFFIFSTIILQLFFAIHHKVGRKEGILLILIYFYFALALLNLLPKP